MEMRRGGQRYFTLDVTGSMPLAPLAVEASSAVASLSNGMTGTLIGPDDLFQPVFFPEDKTAQF
jgi:hypothetical protein